MGRLTSTLLLVVVLAGLGGYIYFVDSKRPADAPGATSFPLVVFDPPHTFAGPRGWTAKKYGRQIGRAHV